MDSNNELHNVEAKDCPFCERSELVPSDEVIHNGAQHIFFVICGGCGTRGPWGGNDSEAVKKWNHRISPESCAE